MEVVKCYEEAGVAIGEPYRRQIKVMMAPDKRNVSEITFTHAIIFPGSKTDYHRHDRPELIQILSGRGISICDGKETVLEPDMALWVRSGEMHQVINTGDETMKLATVFVPGFTTQELLGPIERAVEEAVSRE